MPVLLIITDGMADCCGYGSPTPLREADTPCMDRLASIGACGLVDTSMADGEAPGSDFAILSLLGYNPPPRQARGALEAIGIGVTLSERDVAYRCNFIASDGCGIEIENPQWIDSGIVNRLCCCINNAVGMPHMYPIDNSHAVCIFDKSCGRNYAREYEARVKEILSKDVPDNVGVYREKSRITGIRLWGESDKPEYSRFDRCRAAVVCAVPLVRGIAGAIGMDLIVPEGATGGTDTCYQAKIEAALHALRSGYEFVLLHVEAPDAASHDRDRRRKIATIEAIDRHIVSHAVEWISATPDAIVAMTPDHATDVLTGKHSPDPVPFVIAGRSSIPDSVCHFDELSAQQGAFGQIEAQRFMQLLLSSSAG